MVASCYHTSALCIVVLEWKGHIITKTLEDSGLTFCNLPHTLLHVNEAVVAAPQYASLALNDVCTVDSS